MSAEFRHRAPAGKGTGSSDANRAKQPDGKAFAFKALRAARPRAKTLRVAGLNALFLASALAAAPPAAGATASSDAHADIRGAAGVCVRWGADPKHVEEAVVVVGSGNAELDAALPASIINMEWERPASANYKGEWVGIVLAVGDAPVDMPRPKCDHLPRRSEPTV